MSSAVFEDYLNYEILYVDLTSGTEEDLKVTINDVHKLLRIYRKATPLRILYDTRNATPTKELIQLFSQKLMPYSHKVYRRAFIVNDETIYYMIRTVVDSRNMMKTSFCCEGEVEAFDFLINGERNSGLSLSHPPHNGDNDGEA